MNAERKALARDLVCLEAQYLDEKNWDAWLKLYHEDAVFWVPTWIDEATPANDPQTQLSFIHLEGREYLEERVFRIKSGRSIAAMPAPRTVHVVMPTQIQCEGVERWVVTSSWMSHVYDHKTGNTVHYGGQYEHTLTWQGESFQITRKKVLIANDHLQSKVDFFYI